MKKFIVKVTTIGIALMALGIFYWYLFFYNTKTSNNTPATKYISGKITEFQINFPADTEFGPV